MQIKCSLYDVANREVVQVEVARRYTISENNPRFRTVVAKNRADERPVRRVPADVEKVDDVSNEAVVLDYALSYRQRYRVARHELLLNRRAERLIGRVRERNLPT